MIKSISKQYQIVYFTCHKSREIAKTKAPDALREEIVREAPVLPRSITSSVNEVLGKRTTEVKPRAYHIDGTEAVKAAPRVRKLSPEDELVEELTKISVEDVHPAQIKPVSKTTKPAGPRTIVINRNNGKKE